MEHRWGIRRSLNVGVKLYVRGSPPRFGRLLDASASGGYVATSPPLPIMTRVHVALGWGSARGDRRLRIAGYVVRVDAHGFAIEWQKFAPLPVFALMDAPKPSRSCILLPSRISRITEAHKEGVHAAATRHARPGPQWRTT